MPLYIFFNVHEGILMLISDASLISNSSHYFATRITLQAIFLITMCLIVMRLLQNGTSVLFKHFINYQFDLGREKNAYVA